MQEFTDLLQNPELVEETHAFLWTEPFVNRGMPDLGWSCRDHAGAIGAFLCRAGAEVTLRHGRCMFVLGPTADGRPPVGIGQEADGHGTRHTWLHVTGLGDVDLSPNLNLQVDRWRRVRGPGVIGSSWLADRPTRFIAVPAPEEYGNEIARATHVTDESRAIYCQVRDEPFTIEFARKGLSWANSRVSLRLLDRNLPDDLYVRFARHLDGLVRGERKSLRHVSANKAWVAIAEDPALDPDYSGASGLSADVPPATDP